MSRVVTLGEMMLRLSPPGYARFWQAESMDVNYGGAEANVAASLAQLGHQASYVTKLPENALGDAAAGTLRKAGVDCSHIVRGGERLGIYFLENGASVRPSSVIYDRADSAFTGAEAEEFDFDRIFKGADLFHLSGITPVLSRSAANLTLAALKSAKENGVTVSFDLNYRKKLWTEQAEEKQRLLASLMPYVDICFGNALDAAKCLGYQEGGYDFPNIPYEVCVSEERMNRVVKTYGLKCLITTLRDSISASDNGWSGAVSDGERLYKGREYRLHIVDRVGGGDAFAAGFLHGYLKNMGFHKALEFGLAAAAIKHTIPGDINYISEEEVTLLLERGGSGRVER